MQAMTQDTYGGAEVMQLKDVPTPDIGSTDVLIRVRAAGVNIADWAVMHGLPYIARPVYGLRRPKVSIRGTDLAGVVEAIGPDVSRLRVGDEVFGWGDGSYAEFVAVAQDSLVRKPAGLTFEEAAAVPMAGLVALQAIRDHGKVGPGSRVLINGASGGIGTFAVQIATALGADVTGVCSTRNLDLVRSLGADRVIDYTTDDFTADGQHYDVILDNVSNRSLSELRRALTPTGVLIPNGGNFSNRWMASGGRIVRGVVLFSIGSQSLGNFLVAMGHDDLQVLADMIQAGTVRPVMDRTYPLRDLALAMGHVGDGHARGKVTIAI
jgi:NADPH:quinone reductase-like Zn-dependent oxidoreductase